MGCNWRIGVRAANSHQRGKIIPDLKEKIIKAKDSGMNLNEYFKGIN
ncbi:hypothetical protein HMPREF9075_00790 [Capnocytophaga sp. oral taxon 332 str. F0381]|nr:hypothetical protein HMPREF9075_00790 [Capnocytophaga sp. oral taxon 332 str. F0381]